MHPNEGMAIILLIVFIAILAIPMTGAIITGIILKKRGASMAKRLLLEIVVAVTLFILGVISGLFRSLLDNSF